MIKTFEQFVSTEYGRPVNEAFQSSKLRAIIKQHGKPKNGVGNEMLYDLKDDEIIDIVGSRDEYNDKYLKNADKNEQATFIIELEDGSCVVIGNLGILQNVLSDWDRKDMFKEKRNKRHIGNQGKYGVGEEIHQKHLENVDNLNTKRLAEKIKNEFISKIVDEVESIMNSIDVNEFEFNERDYYKTKSDEIETEIELGDDTYTLYVEYDWNMSDYHKSCGAYISNVYYSLTGFTIIEKERDLVVDNKDIDITTQTYKDLFEEHTEEIEVGIYDKYEYFGVSRSDFF
jgi:hypothetical protein